MEMSGSGYRVTSEDFDSFSSFWREPQSHLKWDCLFVVPPWLEVWWQEFGSSADLYLRAVRRGNAVLGLAPLQIRDDEACFIGSEDLCDFLDFVLTPGSEYDFFEALLEDLKQKGVRRLDLGLLRPESETLRHLVGIAKQWSYEVSCATEDVSLELSLPPTWEEYLGMLSGKQRHEVRRKLRRLREKGEVNYRTVEGGEAVEEVIDLFITFFQESREDKRGFLTPRRESFFRTLARAMAQDLILKIGILEIDTKPAAAIMFFCYDDTVYLYNSGYDPQYRFLSAGLISKIMCIKDSIGKGKRKFDFLKGAEEYKYRLGGEEVYLKRCRITLG
jgi:CelD/BcsL family acetyltransferase involved in cellulose biosynthesis